MRHFQRNASSKCQARKAATWADSMSGFGEAAEFGEHEDVAQAGHDQEQGMSMHDPEDAPGQNYPD